MVINKQVKQHPLKGLESSHSRRSLNILFMMFCISLFFFSTPLQASEKHPFKPFLKNYCIDCHNNKKQKGKINLENIDLTEKPKVWKKVVTALEDYDMPPEDEKQPKEAERLKVIQSIKSMVSKSKNPGYVSMRRMTRLEYDQSVQDLLNLSKPMFVVTDRVIKESKPYFNPASGKMPEEINLGTRLTQHGLEASYYTGLSSLPIDPKAEHGYENNARSLTLSPILMEKYLSVAQSLLNSKQFKKHCRDWKKVFVEPTNKTIQESSKFRIKGLVRKAFRKPVDKVQVKKYTDFFMRTYKEKKSYTKAMIETVSAILSSPDFIMVNKLQYKNDKAGALSAHELANRLALFLWGSIPDKELLQLADSGELLKDEVLKQQAMRMLKDKRVRYLSHSFLMQWLHLKQAMSVSPDKKKFAKFYFDKRYFQNHEGQHTIVEPILLFETILIENRSILEFIDSKYSYVNLNLMQAYKLKGDAKNKKSHKIWRRVNLPNRKRGGVLTSNAVLSLTSTPTRNSAINRGAWISSVIFNSPPPPPPANVPGLDENEESKKFKTIRERFEAHRKDPNCASCHSKIDPLGFAFENYNAIGRWRDKYENKHPVDSSGIYRGNKFSGVETFKDTLLKNKERFTRAFIEHMLSFSLNREISLHDRKTIDSITKKVSSSEYKFHEVILGITQSYPFRYKIKGKENVK